MFDVISIGDSMIDTFVVIDHEEAKLQCDIKKDNYLLCLNYADKIPIKDTHQAIGGNAANVITGLQKLGLKTSIITELGDDLNGLVIKNEFTKNKIDTSLVRLLPGKETRYSIVLNYLGERTTLSYYAKRKYTLPTIPKTKWLYYTSLGDNFPVVQEKIIAYLKKNPETKLAVNPGSLQLKYGLTAFKKILPFTDLLFLNKEEGEKITGKKGEIKNIIKSLHALGVKNVALTDSVNGSYASDGQTLHKLGIFPAVLVEKTGAGDAYASGLLASLISGNSLIEGMRWGTANAAGVTGKIGGQAGLLNKKQILELIKKHPKIQPKLV